MEATELKSVQEALTRASSEMTELKATVDTIKTRTESPETREMIAKIEARIDGIEAKAARPLADEQEEPKTLARVIYDSPEYKAYAERGWHKGGFNINVPRDLFEGKTLITTTAVGSSTPGILVPQRVPGIIKPPVRGLRVRDLLPQFNTTNNAVEYLKENAFTNLASPQTEGSAKAESALTFTISSVPVRTIAHWIPATRQILDDFAQLQAYVETRLVEGLKDKEDSELLVGDGLGDHLTGLITSAAAYDTARNVSLDTRIDKLSHAMSQLEETLFNPTGIVMNPKDWRTITLIKEEPGATVNTGAYLLGSPANDFQERMWSLPIVTTTAMTVGKFLVGDFRTSAAIWDRSGVNVDISTEHSTYFTENKVAIRAEERLALAIYRAGGLIYGSF